MSTRRLEALHGFFGLLLGRGKALIGSLKIVQRREIVFALDQIALRVPNTLLEGPLMLRKRSELFIAFSNRFS